MLITCTDFKSSYPLIKSTTIKVKKIFIAKWLSGNLFNNWLVYSNDVQHNVCSLVMLKKLLQSLELLYGRA